MTLRSFVYSAFSTATIADHFFRNVPYTPNASVWLALGTNAPAGSPTGEPVGNNYARVEIGGASGRTFTAPAVDALGTISNAQTWFWPQVVGGNWGTMTSINVMDAVSGGNHIASASFAGDSQTFNDQELYEIPAGDLYFQSDIGTVAVGVSNYCWTGEGFGKAANLMFRNDATAAAETNVWLGLLEGPIATEAERLRPHLQTSNEVSNGGYARIEVGEDLPATTVGLSRVLSTVLVDAVVNFPTATATYTNPIYYVGIFENAVAGVMLAFAPIRDGGNAAGFVGAGGLTVGKNSFVRLDNADGGYQWEIQ